MQTRHLFFTLSLLLALAIPAVAQPPTGPVTIANAPQHICPLPLGSELPTLPVVALDGTPFDLAAAVRAKPTILIYFRGGW